MENIKTNMSDFLKETNNPLNVSSDNNTTDSTMLGFLKIALKDAFDTLEARVPQTKKKVLSKSILDVDPIDLISFMKKNNIPDDAYFDGRDNGYDGWNDILLSWDIDVPTTKEDKLKFKKRTFSDIAFKKIYDLLTVNGYKRVGYNTALLKEYDNTTIYDMYLNNEFDRLVKYYSNPFKKID